MQSYNSRRSFTELADLRLIYYGVSCCRLGEQVKSCCQHISVHGGCPWRRVSLCLTVVSVSFVSSGLTYCPAAQRGWSDTSQLSRTPARRREDILRLRCFLLCANNNTCIIHIQSCLHLILSVSAATVSSHRPPPCPLLYPWTSSDFLCSRQQSAFDFRRKHNLHTELVRIVFKPSTWHS